MIHSANFTTKVFAERRPLIDEVVLLPSSVMTHSMRAKLYLCGGQGFDRSIGVFGEQTIKILNDTFQPRIGANSDHVQNCSHQRRRALQDGWQPTWFVLGLPLAPAVVNVCQYSEFFKAGKTPYSVGIRYTRHSDISVVSTVAEGAVGCIGVSGRCRNRIVSTSDIADRLI